MRAGCQALSIAYLVRRLLARGPRSARLGGGAGEAIAGYAHAPGARLAQGRCCHWLLAALGATVPHACGLRSAAGCPGCQRVMRGARMPIALALGERTLLAISARVCQRFT